MSYYEDNFDLQEIYSILCKWAKNDGNEIGDYSRLAQEYLDKKQQHIDVHTELNKILGIINNRLSNIEAPPLSALVVNKESQMPGKGFWGCAPNAPKKPSSKDEQEKMWKNLVQDVRNYNWPEILP